MVTNSGTTVQFAVRDGKNISTQTLSSPAGKKTSQKVDLNQSMKEASKDYIQGIEEVKETVSQLEDISRAMGKKLSFNVNKELGEVVVKVIDPSTDKVIKEIPSTEIQQLQIQIKKTLGILFDETV